MSAEVLVRSLQTVSTRTHLLLALAVVCCPACSAKRASEEASAQPAPVHASAPSAAAVASYGYEVLNSWPHDPNAFTQGLIFLQGIFLESTGLNGQSSLRKVDIETGHVRQQIQLNSDYFAEGLTVLGTNIYQLTWQNHKAFVYDLPTFSKTGEFTYEGEGWGLTTDGHLLIMSDGTNHLRFIDPATFKVIRSIDVYSVSGEPLKNLNELEFVEGSIFANVWQTPYVVKINPTNGALEGVVDFSGLLSPSEAASADVLNGIAYDSKNQRLFVTGKNWPKLFEVRLKKR